MPELTAGVNVSLSVDGTDLIVASTATDLNAQTGTTYTLVLTDAGHLVTLTNASPVTLTVPPNASVEFATGTTIAVAQLGAGTVTIEGDTGVTINGVSTGSADISAQYGAAALTKLGTNTWLLTGSVGSVS
jgi:hypothetical protein